MNMSLSPAAVRTNQRISASASLGARPAMISSVTTIAPALTKGLRGLPFSSSRSTTELKALLDDPQRRAEIEKDYAELRQLLGDSGASANAAREMLGRI